jgi:hypothetical protein
MAKISRTSKLIRDMDYWEWTAQTEAEEESRGQLEKEKVTHIAVEEEGRRLAEEQTRLLEEDTQGAAAEQERQEREEQAGAEALQGGAKTPRLKAQTQKWHPHIFFMLTSRRR